MDKTKEENRLIAVPTNDGVDIFSKMLGMSKYLYIYKIENGTYRLIEKRNNPYEKTKQRLKTLDVYEIIKDCNIIVSEKIGKKGIKRLEDRGMKLIFKKGNIEEALIDVIENDLVYK